MKGIDGEVEITESAEDSSKPRGSSAFLVPTWNPKAKLLLKKPAKSLISLVSRTGFELVNH